MQDKSYGLKNKGQNKSYCLLNKTSLYMKKAATSATSTKTMVPIIASTTLPDPTCWSEKGQKKRLKTVYTYSQMAKCTDDGTVNDIGDGTVNGSGDATVNDLDDKTIN